MNWKISTVSNISLSQTLKLNVTPCIKKKRTQYDHKKLIITPNGLLNAKYMTLVWNISS